MQGICGEHKESASKYPVNIMGTSSLVHSSVARAADCRSAGPWFKSGFPLLCNLPSSTCMQCFHCKWSAQQTHLCISCSPAASRDSLKGVLLVLCFALARGQFARRQKLVEADHCERSTFLLAPKGFVDLSGNQQEVVCALHANKAADALCQCGVLLA